MLSFVSLAPIALLGNAGTTPLVGGLRVLGGPTGALCGVRQGGALGIGGFEGGALGVEHRRL